LFFKRLALRINVLAKGHSGISPENLRKLVKALNTNVVSVVPCKGTVGASGDLAPLSHLVLGMLGDGLMWDPEDMQQKPAQVLLEKYKLEKLDLGPKEGLALINGTQFITALGCVRLDFPCIFPIC
jgi:histidine ammonia-lyase